MFYTPHTAWTRDFSQYWVAPCRLVNKLQWKSSILEHKECVKSQMSKRELAVNCCPLSPTSRCNQKHTFILSHTRAHTLYGQLVHIVCSVLTRDDKVQPHVLPPSLGENNNCTSAALERRLHGSDSRHLGRISCQVGVSPQLFKQLPVESGCLCLAGDLSQPRGGTNWGRSGGYLLSQTHIIHTSGKGLKSTHQVFLVDISLRVFK